MSSTTPCSSSGGRRRSSLRVGGVSSSLRPRAWAPLRPSMMPNSTRCPLLSSVTPLGRALRGTKTSPPSSLVTNPYPLVASYHFTRPVGTADLDFGWAEETSTTTRLTRTRGPVRRSGAATAARDSGRRPAQAVAWDGDDAHARRPAARPDRRGAGRAVPPAPGPDRAGAVGPVGGGGAGAVAKLGRPGTG